MGEAARLLVLVAFKQWRRRPRAGETAPAPKWMSSLDGFGPAKALGAGVVRLMGDAISGLSV